MLAYKRGVASAVRVVDMTVFTIYTPMPYGAIASWKSATKAETSKKLIA